MDDNRPGLVAHVLESLEGGGTERTLTALLAAFDPRRLRHEIVTLRKAGRLAERLPDHAACRPLEAQGRARLTGLRLARVLRKSGAEIVHARNTCCWADALLARLFLPGIRLVLGFHGLDNGELFSVRQRRLARWGIRLGARFTSVSEAGRRQLQDQAGVPPHLVEVIANGVDLTRFSVPQSTARRRVRRVLRFGESDLAVGIVGSLSAVKGHKVLLDALVRASAAVPSLTACIVGDGPQRSSLQEKAHSAGLADRVRFTGWREGVARLLPAMDLYVCSSLSEGMNNALLEAMASGLPVVATDVGDNARVIRDEVDGLIAAPGSIESLAVAIVRLARDSGTRREFAVAARRRVESFDFRQTVAAYERYYGDLLNPRGALEGEAPTGTPDRSGPKSLSLAR